MANLVKIAELLKNASDQSLMQELNNPNGAAPSYMVLSELQRRKKLRGSLMNNEPVSSVAEDLEAESAQAPQMGLGSMGQAPMQQAPVSMASGGEVKHFYAGGGYDVGGGQYTSEPGWNPFAGIDWTGKSGWSDEQDRLYKDLLVTGMTPEQAKARVFGTETSVKPAAAPQAAPAPAPAGVPQGRPQGRPAAPTGGIPSLGAAPKASDDYSVNPLLDELKGYRKQMADAYKQQADAYKQQAQEIKDTKATDIGLALMQAGFGMAGGRSQYALENIGQGAMPAIQQYAGMDRARREQLQKLALGQGALGIEQLGAQMKGVTAEGELGLGGEKMDIARRSAAADEMRARASLAAVGNQAAQWKQENAQERVNQQKANTLINYLKTDGINLDDATKAQYISEINRLLKTSPAPQNKLTGNAKEGYKYGYN